jgi:hypothetical protein
LGVPLQDGDNFLRRKGKASPETTFPSGTEATATKQPKIQNYSQCRTQRACHIPFEYETDENWLWFRADFLLISLKTFMSLRP